MKILWLAPNFNHYKARFLNHLAVQNDVDLTILSGTGRDNMGDQELDENWGFELIKVNVSKKNFGKSIEVKQKLKLLLSNFDWVLIPAEKKNLSLFFYAIKLRKLNKSVRLFSYNHAKLKSKNGVYGFLDYKLSKFFNRYLNRVIYYTEEASKFAVEQKLVSPQKAFWANNTIDNTEIEKYYNFQLPPEELQTILFIGRLIPSKRIKDVIAYYKALKPNFKQLRLEIIGDGPEQNIVKDAIQKDTTIKWHGTLVDEAKIAPIMKRTSLVFIPGLSGLSINHAFAYGRPYITLKAEKHGPEISYLENDKNGYILDDNIMENTKIITSLLQDRVKLIELCNSAKQKGEELSVQKWVQQIKASLLNE
ncbi:glycosyltransferase family 4 protein [Winogradskyella echinorum]|uniref:Glycosyltransferase family 4 protein n=1 Tax=Winogradskyella echinorum TaxID=538189 RepID=A0ABR6XXG8_9FLAO|nr:glycosyltransferase [Winogradskyella echinorum]MBC3845166.1 glycosyltransferase family 4 protein [Winogradskyella echinorum]MBC5749514.1 glycosyltransferase family 4 protein [Winogradskyella echinorum]